MRSNRSKPETLVRSRIHMLSVAAARLEEAGASKLLIDALREDAKRESGKMARGEVRNRAFQDEEQRIARQRNFFTFLPPGNAKDALLEAMLQRAYDLMWEGMCTETDALAEFLPSVDVRRMLEAWEHDQSRDEKSEFYRK